MLTSHPAHLVDEGDKSVHLLRLQRLLGCLQPRSVVELPPYNHLLASLVTLSDAAIGKDVAILHVGVVCGGSMVDVSDEVDEREERRTSGVWGMFGLCARTGDAVTGVEKRAVDSPLLRPMGASAPPRCHPHRLAGSSIKSHTRAQGRGFYP